MPDDGLQLKQGGDKGMRQVLLSSSAMRRGKSHCMSDEEQTEATYPGHRAQGVATWDASPCAQPMIQQGQG